MFLHQRPIYRFNYNFEPNDIEIIIDDEKIIQKYKGGDEYKYDEKLNEPESLQFINYELTNNYIFYWNFNNEGIHIIKIIFKKKLMDFNSMFYHCNNIIEIDCSHLDCSECVSANGMFWNCYSLKKINLGKLDFSLVTDFSSMFLDCKELEEIDVSNFNTKNCEDFSYMFHGCSKVKILDVSNFNTSKCKEITGMFRGCQNITEINMMNWDMKNIKNINQLFLNCKKINSIKISANFNDIEIPEDNCIFEDIPENGEFIWKKGNQINNILSLLPVTWNRKME